MEDKIIIDYECITKSATALEGININKEIRHNYTSNPIQGYTEDHPYYIYAVYYENEEVAEFGSNKFDIFSQVLNKKTESDNKYQTLPF